MTGSQQPWLFLPFLTTFMVYGSSWETNASTIFLPASLFSCDTPIFGGRERGRRRNLPPVFKAVKLHPSSWHLKSFHKHIFSWHTTLFMYLFRARLRGTHTQSPRSVFEPSTKSNFAGSSWRTGKLHARIHAGWKRSGNALQLSKIWPFWFGGVF